MNNKIKNIKSIDDLKNLLENPSFTLDNLREIITEPKSLWFFDDRLTIPIFRKIMNKYEELDLEDVKEMYLNSAFFDEEFEVKDNAKTIEKYISLIEYWKYVDSGFPFVVVEEKEK